MVLKNGQYRPDVGHLCTEFIDLELNGVTLRLVFGLMYTALSAGVEGKYTMAVGDGAVSYSR